MTKLTFLGTGTSQGVPVISCGCWVCTSDDSRDKRFRSSVLIETAPSHNPAPPHDTGGLTLVIDAGPDFRSQMLRADVKKLDAILLTHEHKDHIGGLDDVRAFNYTSSKPVDIYAEKRVIDVIKKDFDYAFGEHKYPGAPDMNLHMIGEQPFKIKDIEIIPIRGLHYKLPVLGYRIGSVGYITDFNHIEQSEIEKLKGVDVMVINALQKQPHMSHFTLDEALHLSWQIGARETYFTHISHQMGRHAAEEPKLPAGNHFAYDGLVVES